MIKNLLVEGNADLRVVESIIRQYNIPYAPSIITPCGGFNELNRMIEPTIQQSEIAVLGVIVDADSHMNGRWQRLQQEFGKAGYSLPDDLPKNGFILNGEVRIGIWIMPDNSLNGMLEDFMRLMIPDDDRLKIIVEETLSEIEAQNLNKYTISHRPKAFIHTWLAWQDEPGMPMGQSINKHYFPTNNELCVRFADWLNKLYQ